MSGSNTGLDWIILEDKRYRDLARARYDAPRRCRSHSARRPRAFCSEPQPKLQRVPNEECQT